MSYDATSPPVPAPVSWALRSPSGLATALTVLLAVAGAVDLAAGLIGFGTEDGAGAGFGADDPLTRETLLLGSVALVQLALLVATGVVFIIWFHRVRVNGGAFRPDLFSQGPGWAIGAWFVPFLNLVRPFRIAKEIWAASVQAGPDGSARALSVTPITLWWMTFVGSNLVSRGSASAGDLLSAVSAVFAVLFVRKLTALQVTKATQGPYAAS
ncbi:DUF4328 domain-containing protein [Streptomyces sp. NBC_00536]|uniref:DUF4328 domain-containing protein n=1 Tax=Streptomyces sp. NBC_00536 TaxID=2975769 RepID=UPI002E824321|nr:DUF4328 domain-containing protein [Streptomyces sp. NBC_00536]WUC77566.1 DUF4328 domain-containing protein [Streptomyces sp. NBC_00536]